MQLPFFYEEDLPFSNELELGEESSRHIVQVLRMHPPAPLVVTNGKGETLNAVIVVADKKRTKVKITGRNFSPHKSAKLSLGVSLIKSKSRFEWLLEKATEIGVSEIIPLICHHTERQHFNSIRMKSILVSAMLQSQQHWLPLLQEPVKFEDIITSMHPHKFIAYCTEQKRKQLSLSAGFEGDQLILIGPEGDFAPDEIEMALRNNFVPVTLGETRLRTETAAIVAAVLLINK